MDITCVDLFCGAGGLTAGFERAGVPVSAGIDVDSKCRYPYEHNNNAEFVESDVCELSSRQVDEFYPAGADRVLAGCAPCQPFSTLGSGDRSGDEELLGEFERFVADVEPEYVVMENVPGIRGSEVYSKFMETLLRRKYSADFEEIYCPDYGIPQKRKRFLLIASKHGEIELPESTHSKDEYPTVQDAIGDGKFSKIESGESDDEDSLHYSRTLSDKNLRRIRQSSPGGTWEEWDEELILECHKKDSGQSYGSVYGRMEWGKPAPTITTQFHNYGSGRFGHPEQDRAISLREGATLQTFPEDYTFVPDDEEIGFEKIAPMIGNAVPVRLAEQIANKIREHHEENENVKN